MTGGIRNEFYGDSTRWFFGIVVDGSPPSSLEGRVKVRIYGIHDGDVNNIPQVDLPWAQVLIPGTSPGVSGLGAIPQLLPGALVFGVFLDGKDSQLPLILGSVAKEEFPTSVQAQGRDDPSVNLFAYNYSGELDDNFDIEDDLTRIRISLKFFIDNGYTLEQATGMVATLYTVSELKPTFRNTDNFGIAGWDLRDRRWTRLINFAGRFYDDKVPERLDLQLFYVLHELRTIQRIANGKLMSTDKIKSTQTSNALKRGSGSVEIMADYYIPKTSRVKINLDDAISIAEDIYNFEWQLI